MKRVLVEGFHCVPDGVQNAMRYAAAHQWQAFVKQNGAVAAFQQLRRLGGQTTVRLLVDLLAPGVITAEGYIWLALALKYGSCLSHTMLQGLATAKHVEVVQERTRAPTDIQLDDDGSQALEQVRVQETGDVIKYFYWWQLRVVAAKEHKVAMERELGQVTSRSAVSAMNTSSTQSGLLKNPFWTRCFSRESVSAASNWRHAT